MRRSAFAPLPRMGAGMMSTSAGASAWNGSYYLWSGSKFFNGDWYFEDRMGGDTGIDCGGGSGDGTAGRYRPQNCTINGSGYLDIIAKAESYAGASYTCGALQWSSLTALYGTIEVRCQFSSASGMSPAVWTVGSNCQQTFKSFEDNCGSCQWPLSGSGEIDVAEILTGHTEYVNFQIHTQVSGTPYNDGVHYYPPGGVDLSAAFHTYTMVWTPGNLHWYFDGADAYSLTSAGVPDYPSFLIMNLAVGPSGQAVVPAALPSHFLIDYVKYTPP